MIFHASKRGAGPGFCAAAATARAIEANARKQGNLMRGLTFATTFQFPSGNPPDCCPSGKQSRSGIFRIP
jgi:hypothetical protein